MSAFSEITADEYCLKVETFCSPSEQGVLEYFANVGVPST